MALITRIINTFPPYCNKVLKAISEPVGLPAVRKQTLGETLFDTLSDPDITNAGVEYTQETFENYTEDKQGHHLDFIA